MKFGSKPKGTYRTDTGKYKKANPAKSRIAKKAARVAKQRGSFTHAERVRAARKGKRARQRTMKRVYGRG